MHVHKNNQVYACNVLKKLNIFNLYYKMINIIRMYLWVSSVDVGAQQSGQPDIQVALLQCVQ
jgi:hypothetical protein